MINALICTYLASDVLPFTIGQLLLSETVTRILVADGPSVTWKGGPSDVRRGISTKGLIERLHSSRVFYEYTSGLEYRSDKNNSILRNVSPDCEWLLVVDSDEVYHENDLECLTRFLSKDHGWDRWRIKERLLYPDIYHYIELNRYIPRLYKWGKGAHFKQGHEMQQFLYGTEDQRWNSDDLYGTTELPEGICKHFHLGSLRMPAASWSWVKNNGDGTATWKGAKKVLTAPIMQMSRSSLPFYLRTIEEGEKNAWLTGSPTHLS
jgi:hypothetical protein